MFYQDVSEGISLTAATETLFLKLKVWGECECASWRIGASKARAASFAPIPKKSKMHLAQNTSLLFALAGQK